MKRGTLRLIEVGPRDGLQNEPNTIPLDAKIAFVNGLGKTGVAEIEVSSFVSSRWVPQLGDAEDVFLKIDRAPGVIYSALVPNEKGLDRALACDIDKISVFTAASEVFNKHNINASIKESIERFRPVVERSERPVRGYISTAIWCPYEGKIEPSAVVDVAKQLIDLGVSELSVADTVGKASPPEVRALLDALLPCAVPVALHFHDTYGMAIANVLTAYKEYGIASFDGSAGGLGGCPYAPGASGNVATEDLAFAFGASGVEVGVDINSVIEAARPLEQYLGRPLASRLSQVPEF